MNHKKLTHGNIEKKLLPASFRFDVSKLFVKKPNHSTTNNLKLFIPLLHL